MSVWEFIGWLIVVPLTITTALFAYAASVAVARAIVRGMKNQKR